MSATAKTSPLKASDKTSVVNAEHSRKDLHAAGKALRDKCPRDSHAGWKAPRDWQRRENSNLRPPGPEPGGLPADSLQPNSNLLQRNSNITAIEFQQFQ